MSSCFILYLLLLLSILHTIVSYLRLTHQRTYSPRDPKGVAIEKAKAIIRALVEGIEEAVVMALVEVAVGVE